MTEHLQTVLVLMGGPDAEREVSLMSGRAIAQAIRDTERFRVIEQIINTEDASSLSAMMQDDAGNVDVVFPALHGPWGEGGPLQEILTQIGVPYIGSGPRASALAMNKVMTKSLLAGIVPSPSSRQLMPNDECELDPPVVLKPIDDGSSVDMRICRTVEDIDTARTALHPGRGALLAERFIEGRELTVGIICGEALPLIEIVPAVEFYDYDAKYERDDTRYILNPQVPPEVARQCAMYAIEAFHRLGCRDLARADFMLDDVGPWFLEINTMPGFTSHSLVPMAASHAGMKMPDLCATLIDAALDRRRSPCTSGG